MMENAMLSPANFSDLAPLGTAAADYDVVRRAIAHITRQLARRSRRSSRSPKPPASRRPNCTTCSAAGPG